MKKIVLLLLFAALAASSVMADEITFSFILGAPNTLTASPSGLSAGPAMNIIVSDATTGQEFPLVGTFTTHTGASSSFVTTSSLVLAGYNGAGPLSVLIVDPMNNVVIAGSLNDNASFLTQIPNGAGSFLGSFEVSAVAPSVFALFGLPQKWLPTGSVSATFANDNFNSITDTVHGQLGGGSVTFETPVPEPATLGMMGSGLLVAAFGLRRKLA